MMTISRGVVWARRHDEPKELFMVDFMALPRYLRQDPMGTVLYIIHPNHYPVNPASFAKDEPENPNHIGSTQEIQTQHRLKKKGLQKLQTKNHFSRWFFVSPRKLEVGISSNKKSSYCVYNDISNQSDDNSDDGVHHDALGLTYLILITSSSEIENTSNNEADNS